MPKPKQPPYLLPLPLRSLHSLATEWHRVALDLLSAANRIGLPAGENDQGMNAVLERAAIVSALTGLPLRDLAMMALGKKPMKDSAAAFLLDKAELMQGMRFLANGPLDGGSDGYTREWPALVRLFTHGELNVPKTAKASTPKKPRARKTAAV
ncbi:MAG: hypothetical protein ABMA00_17785 [Gemmatimonas sp.]